MWPLYWVSAVLVPGGAIFSCDTARRPRTKRCESTPKKRKKWPKRIFVGGKDDAKKRSEMPKEGKKGCTYSSASTRRQTQYSDVADKTEEVDLGLALVILLKSPLVIVEVTAHSLIIKKNVSVLFVLCARVPYLFSQHNIWPILFFGVGVRPQ